MRVHYPLFYVGSLDGCYKLQADKTAKNPQEVASMHLAFLNCLALSMLVVVLQPLRAEQLQPAPSAKTAVESIQPFMGKPVLVPADEKAANQLEKRIHAYMALPVEKVQPHPAAADFPGAVRANAPHVTRVVEAHGTGARCPTKDEATEPWEYWHSTGLYAAPGETVTIKALDQLPQDAEVCIQIGCHTDLLFGENIETSDEGSDSRKVWRRFPELTRSFEMKGAEIKVANAFGGPIFITAAPVAGETKASPARFRLEISNAVEAPTFVLGKTTIDEWRKLRDAPAPWGELIGHKMALHVPSEALRRMDDPARLLEFYDKVVAAEDKLVGWGDLRTGPERVVLDREIEAGWMHSGYPFMAHLESLPDFLDIEKLKKQGEWGFFHELGHNHQSSAWTFSKPFDQTEVTVNLFSFYCMEHVCGRPRCTGHEAIEGDNLEKALERRFSKKPTDDAFDQLTGFIVLLHRFGWEPLEQTLASYQAKPVPEDMPESAKQAEFVERYSRNAHADLSAYFSRLGYSCPASRRERLKSLPAFDFNAWRTAFIERNAKGG